MNVLVACEFSGTVRDAFSRYGWNAWSCDILPTEKRGQHLMGDVRKVLADTSGKRWPAKWDLLIAHPPCTFLTTSGNRWFYHPDDTHLPVNERRPHPLYPTRSQDREDAIAFVKFLWAQKDIPHICIENPLGILPRFIGPYSQAIHPYQFGHDVSKSTCLWLKNLPNLKPTKYVEPRITAEGNKRWGNQVDASGADKTPPGPNRWKLRSRTYQGIANAMAKQFTEYLSR